jgi:ABC-type multidrug transport system fused ATPase/permease subunit
MFKLIVELFSLLSQKQRRSFWKLQVLVILMAFAEIVGIASIAPFMALVANIELLQSKNTLSSIYIYFGFISPYDFVFWMGVIVLSVLATTASISIYTTWRLSLFGAKIGAELGDQLYSHYLKQDWLFHVNENSAHLTKQVANEVDRVSNQIIRSLILINAKLVIVIFILIGIVIYDPIIAILGLTLFSISYLVLYNFFRKRLKNNGIGLSILARQRYQLMNEGFGGIKDILLLGRNQDFVERFHQTSNLLAYSKTSNAVIAQAPRYFIEFLAFGSMIALVLYLLAKHQGELAIILPVLSVYALAAFKLLPAFQQIYNSLTQMKIGEAAFNAIKDDLVASQKDNNDVDKSSEKILLIPKESICLKNITFTYKKNLEPALDSLNMTIKVNNVVGIVGLSGAGKSTLIDVLLGLIEPQKGQLLIDKQPISQKNRRQWQNTIGFVPQSIFLSEGSIAANVAFGISEAEIDLRQVENALRLAHLDDLIASLSDGVDTKVGERGVKLSGGQRQRIGIARALYHKASVLVFDEATSALDGITERMIMDAIHDFHGQKTIILIAHRLKTVEKCDSIFVMEKGQIIDQGSHQDLMKRSRHFRQMASSS